ncbi:MAG: beta-N-acetylhexosaminidase [Elusimicrobia bacterium]|nr:beta-N-acetylhexosaminidase [Elusimicrobiota bacterium]
MSAAVLASYFLVSAAFGREPVPSLSLEQKVGQLFVVVTDTESAKRDEDLVRGGLVSGGLLRWDRFSAEELASFTAWLRARSPEGLPFLVFADHEGGPLFTQKSFGATIMPGNMALGAAGSEDLAEAAAKASAGELAALGVHADFAPAVDVNSNPRNPIIGVRSYGEDPGLVSRLGAAQVRGYLAGGVLPVVKHFPGHGDTAVDSHVGLPSVERGRAAFDSVELPPFRAAIAAGAPMVMPAHLMAPALGAEGVPVTFSGAALEGVLRGELGFRGVIVSDSLDMGAVAKSTDVAEGSVLAFLAGCDLLLTGKTDYRRTFAHFLGAVRAGRVPLARLDASVERVLELKSRLPKTPPPPPAGGPAAARAVARAALTVKGSGGLRPVLGTALAGPEDRLSGPQAVRGGRRAGPQRRRGGRGGGGGHLSVGGRGPAGTRRAGRRAAVPRQTDGPGQPDEPIRCGALSGRQGRPGRLRPHGVHAGGRRRRTGGRAVPRRKTPRQRAKTLIFSS